MSDSSCVSSVSAAQQASTYSQIQISVYAKQLESQKQSGDAIVELLEAVVQLSKEAGKGEGLDALL